MQKTTSNKQFLHNKFLLEFMFLNCKGHQFAMSCPEWFCLSSYLSRFFQENKIKEELEKKIDKLREQADINKQEIEQGKTKIEEVTSSYSCCKATYKQNKCVSKKFIPPYGAP